MEFKIYKGRYGTKCVRKFSSLEEAEHYLNTRDLDCIYRIEWVEPADEEHGIRERENVLCYGLPYHD